MPSCKSITFVPEKQAKDEAIVFKILNMDERNIGIFWEYNNI